MNMTAQAKGSFEIQGTPNAPRPLGDDATALHMTFRKQLQGELAGTSVVEMFGMMNRELGSGAYVALERLVVSLHGKVGTFCLLHSSSMDRGKPTQRITVVPDSGTGELAGLTGSFTIDIIDGKHFYTFEYAIENR